MCSIGGWISTEPLGRYVAQNLARALLYYGRGRGMQSGGVSYNGRVLKRAMDPASFADLDDFDSLFNEELIEGEGRVCLTHTRQPTCGGRGDAQAQPFTHGDATTCHNGWYYDTLDIRKTFNIKKPSGVDSELACRYISAYGPLRLPDFIEGSAGASAIACKWKDELYLMRAGNPIVYTHLSLGDKKWLTVFASTEEQLFHAIRYVFLVDDDELTSHTLKEGYLFRVNPGQLEKLSKDRAEHDYGMSNWGYYGGTHDIRDEYWKRWEDGDTTPELSRTLDSHAICKAWLDPDEYSLFKRSNGEETEMWISTALERRDTMVSDPDDENFELELDPETPTEETPLD